MTVAEFKSELETFLQGLRVHQAAWRNAQGWPLSGVKRQALEGQGQQLARQLGRLRPIIHRFMAPHEWLMHQPATGIRWNALDAAVGTNDMVKASSMNEVISKLNQLLGRLDGMNQTDDLGKPASPGPIGMPPTPAPDPPSPAAPPSTPPEQPFTLDKLSLGQLFAGLRRLSIPAAITVFGIIAALIIATARIAGWMDQRSTDAMRDSVRVQQRMIDAQRHRGDSLAAALTRRTGKKP